MSFTRITDFRLVDGTCLQGYVKCSYAELVKAFGAPEGGVDGKIQAEWSLLFDGETVATVYDWKEYGTPPESITNWNIGGNDRSAVRLVESQLRASGARVFADVR